MFGLLRNHQATFQSSYTILQSHWQGVKVPLSPHPRQHLLLPRFFIQPSRWVWSAISSWLIPLRTHDKEHPSVTFSALWKLVHSDLLPIFKVSTTLNTYLLSAIWFANILSNSMGCLCTSLMIPMKHKSFSLWSSLIYWCVFFGCLHFGVLSRKPLPNPSHEDLLLRFLLGFIVLAPTLRSIIHLS